MTRTAPKTVAVKHGRALPTRKHKAAASFVFIPREAYQVTIDALMAQGLERADAVDTLKVGIREANGRPVPKQLLFSISQAQPMAAA